MSNNTNVLSYSSTNVTTSTYTTLFTSTPITTSHIQISDTSGQLMLIAVGLAGAEVPIFSIPANGSIIVPIYVIAAQRLSIKAVNANATTGYNIVSLLKDGS